jgi:tetratricopeptide (TPR) repeat protein
MLYKLLPLLLAVGGCAQLRLEARVNQEFRAGLLEQMRGNSDRAQDIYRHLLTLDGQHGAALNNLALISIERGQLIVARRLLARALEKNPTNLVALTNYGVVSYHLADLGPAKHALTEARRLRQLTVDEVPSDGRSDWTQARFLRLTQALDRITGEYLVRIERVQGRDRHATPLMTALRLGE